MAACMYQQLNTFHTNAEMEKLRSNGSLLEEPALQGGEIGAFRKIRTAFCFWEAPHNKEYSKLGSIMSGFGLHSEARTGSLRVLRLLFTVQSSV